jgi:hypothetical protein
MSGTQFDPSCAAAFLAIQAQIIEEMRKENQTAVVQKPARIASASSDTPSTGTTPGLPKLKSDSQSSLSATNRTAIDVGPPPVSNGSGSFHTSSKRL